MKSTTTTTDRTSGGKTVSPSTGKRPSRKLLAPRAQSPNAGIYTAGAVSALIIVLVFLVEMIAVAARGLPPTTVEDWFSVFQAGRGSGLLRTFALDVVAVSMHIPFYLALFYILKGRGNREGLLLTAIVLAVVGVAVYLGTNTTFSMLSLSDKYAAATTEAEKAKLLSAGEAVLAVYNGTGPFAAYALYAVAGILVSVIMLLGKTFSRIVGVLGIVGNALELGLPPSLDSGFFMKIDPFLIAAGGVAIIVWYAMVAVRLIRGRTELDY
jgi:hypothetical protein